MLNFMLEHLLQLLRATTNSKQENQRKEVRKLPPSSVERNLKTNLSLLQLSSKLNDALPPSSDKKTLNKDRLSLLYERMKVFFFLSNVKPRKKLSGKLI